LIDLYGEQLVRKLFSKTWQLREEALNEIEEESSAGRYGDEEAFVNGVGAVKLTVQDKMAGVGQRAM